MSERHQLTFAPGVLDALLATHEEESRAGREGYTYYLAEMDIAQSARAHAILTEKEVDHASPAGYVCFKTFAERETAIRILEAADPIFVGRWQKDAEFDSKEGGSR